MKVNKIKELEEKVPVWDEELQTSWAVDYEQPLADYILTLAEVLVPFSPEAIECRDTQNAGLREFTIRYQDGDIDTSFIEKYQNDSELLETISTMGYDVHKFWYLILFISDYSYGFAERGIKPKESPKKQVKNFIKKIDDNIDSEKRWDWTNLPSSFKKPMKLTLEIKGNNKLIIDDEATIAYLAMFGFSKMKEPPFLGMDDHMTTRGLDSNGNVKCDKSSTSVRIYYFTLVFQKFFELCPPTRKRASKGTTISLNKMQLISNLVYLTGLSENKKFKCSDDIIKGIKRQYIDKDLYRINGIYFS